MNNSSPKHERESLKRQIAELWQSLPFRWCALALFSGWVLLFVRFGNNTFGYADTSSLFSWLYRVSVSSQDDDYCLIMPLVVLALLIWKRTVLTSIQKNVWLPSVGLLLVGIVLHLGGYLVQQSRVSLLGFIVGLYGISGMVWGRQWLRHTFFPMFLLVFMIPLGGIQDSLTLPLRILVTKLAVGLGNLFLGLGFEAQGSLIFDGNGTPVFDVAPACSGIRSLVSMFALATIYAFVQFDSTWKRAAIVFSAIPLAVMGNLARLSIVLVVSKGVSFEAGAAIEQKLGLLTFLVAFVGIFLIGKWIGEDRKDGGSTEESITDPV